MPPKRKMLVKANPIPDDYAVELQIDFPEPLIRCTSPIYTTWLKRLNATGMRWEKIVSSNRTQFYRPLPYWEVFEIESTLKCDSESETYSAKLFTGRRGETPNRDRV